jgi:arylsulfatase A-like enzyme
MKDELLPGLDMAFSGLIGDLDRRGMLDETLVLLMSEHGRTPKIATNVSGGGRDHWSRCYSLVMAGAGIKRGHIVGKSDRIAGDVVDNPVSPKDILATTLHLLGYDHTETIQDRQQRPMPLVAESRILTEVLS